MKKASEMAGLPYNRETALEKFNKGENFIRLFHISTGYLISENGLDNTNDPNTGIPIDSKFIINYRREIIRNTNEIINNRYFLDYNNLVIERLFNETL